MTKTRHQIANDVMALTNRELGIELGHGMPGCAFLSNRTEYQQELVTRWYSVLQESASRLRTGVVV